MIAGWAPGGTAMSTIWTAGSSSMDSTDSKTAGTPRSRAVASALARDRDVIPATRKPAWA